MSSFSRARNVIFVFLIGCSLLPISSCQRGIFESPSVAPATLRDVPALRLNYRYEPDVPAPPAPAQPNAGTEERNQAVQTDFDQNRPQELLDKTVVSPDKNRVLAIYHRAGDAASEFRLDMYAADGKLLRKITPDSMAAHFPDTFVWSPDSTTLAFVAMVRAGGAAAAGQQTIGGAPETGNQIQAANANVNSATPNAHGNANANTEASVNSAEMNTEANAATTTATAPTPAAPTGILTFRTEQIYVCNADGDAVKPVTQNEGLIYFYYVWSPDSQMLASLAATFREWQFLNYQAEQKGEAFVPLGRPRLVEKTGRERRLDDALTQVRPVWSPDSAKIAIGFDKQLRIYDAIGNAPTQAAIPLRNQLLLSSQTFDQELQRQEAANSGANANGSSSSSAAANQAITTLPDEASLVSFNPITAVQWTANEMLYFQTGYVKRMKNEADSARSYLRWHRLILSPQAVSLSNQ